MSYRELHREVVKLRKARGVVEIPVFDTVHRCLQPGRSRLDMDLVVDIASVLLRDDTAAATWRQTHQVITGLASSAAIVHVLDGLPEDVTGFTGRRAEIAAIVDLAEAHAASGEPATLVVNGMAGVGKTTLAVHVAHQLARRDRFHGLALMVNLRGYDRQLPPADPAAVLEEFLRRLGVPGSQIPGVDLAGRTAKLRELLAGRHAVILLDNAASEDQIRPLLPDSPSCLTLITSRRLLSGLPADSMPLDVLSPVEALDLLRRGAGAERIDAEPSTAARIGELVGHLPLALSLAASRIRTSPGWTLHDHVERLRERRAALRLEDGVETSVSLSYDQLPDEHRQGLRLLALHPGPHLDRHAAAALLDWNLADTERRLTDLLGANLLQRPRPDRFELHDVVRVFAANQAHDADPPRTRHAALTRLFDHYRRAVLSAMELYAPHARGRPSTPADNETPRPGFADRDSALAWLRAERPNVIASAVHAAESGWPAHTVAISEAFGPYLAITGQLREAEVLHTHAVDSSQDADQGRALTRLAGTYLRLGRHRDAIRCGRLALTVLEHTGDDFAKGSALNHLGVVYMRRGRLAEALQCLQQVATISRRTEDRALLGYALGNLAMVYERLGRYPQAIEHGLRNLAIVRETGDRAGQSQVLGVLGGLYQLMDQHRRAVDQLQQALAAAREVDYRAGECYALSRLGVAYARLGQAQRAVNVHEQALTIAREIGHRDLEMEILNDMADSLRRLGMLPPAVERHREALTAAEELGDRYEQARAHEGLGLALAASGDPGAARHHRQRALAIRTDLASTKVRAAAAHLTAQPATDVSG